MDALNLEKLALKLRELPADKFVWLFQTVRETNGAETFCDVILDTHGYISTIGAGARIEHVTEKNLKTYANIFDTVGLRVSPTHFSIRSAIILMMAEAVSRSLRA